MVGSGGVSPRAPSPRAPWFRRPLPRTQRGAGRSHSQGSPLPPARSRALRRGSHDRRFLPAGPLRACLCGPRADGRPRPDLPLLRPHQRRPPLRRPRHARRRARLPWRPPHVRRARRERLRVSAWHADHRGGPRRPRGGARSLPARRPHGVRRSRRRRHAVHPPRQGHGRARPAARARRAPRPLGTRGLRDGARLPVGAAARPLHGVGARPARGSVPPPRRGRAHGDMGSPQRPRARARPLSRRPAPPAAGRDPD